MPNSVNIKKSTHIWGSAGLLTIWLLWITIPFYNIGMATNDQLGFSLMGTNVNFFEHVWNLAIHHGRIYFLKVKIFDILLASYPEVFAIKLLCYITFIGGPFCFAYSILDNKKERILFIWIYFNVVWISFYYFAPASYPVVNYLPFLWWAIFAYIIRKYSQADQVPVIAYVFIFLLSFNSFFQYEPITALSFLGLGWSIYHTHFKKKTIKVAFTISYLSAFILYMVLFLAWYIQHPSTYEGASLGDTSIITLVKTWFKYTLGALPAVALLHDPKLVIGDILIGEKIVHYFDLPLLSGLLQIKFFEISLSFLAAVSIFNLLKQPDCTSYQEVKKQGHKSTNSNWLLLLFVLFALIALNGPISFSEKYQQWAAPHLAYPYVTSQLSLLPLCLLGIFLYNVFQLFKLNIRNIMLFILIFFTMIVGIVIHNNNKAESVRLRAHLSKWLAIKMLASCNVIEGKMRAPQLFLNYNPMRMSWELYWQQYARQRFNYDISPKYSSESTLPYVQIKHFDDGSLRYVVIHGKDKTTILTEGHLPNYIMSSNGDNYPVKSLQIEKCQQNQFYYSSIFHSPTTDLQTVEGFEVFDSYPINNR